MLLVAFRAVSQLLRTSSPSSNNTPDLRRDQLEYRLPHHPVVSGHPDSNLPAAVVPAGTACFVEAGRIRLQVGHIALVVVRSRPAAGTGLGNCRSSLRCRPGALGCSRAAHHSRRGAQAEETGDIAAARLACRISETWLESGIWRVWWRSGGLVSRKRDAFLVVSAARRWAAQLGNARPSRSARFVRQSGAG